MNFFQQIQETNILPLYKSIPPFIKFKNGFGFLGVILWDSLKNKVQCHICGKWFKGLSPHLIKHKLNAFSYKELVGLNIKTPLTSLGTKEKQQKIALKNYKNKCDKLIKGNKFYFKNHKRITIKPPKRIQYYNTFGTCDIQLKDKFFVLKKKIGRVPRKEEVYFFKTLSKRFGSYNKALQAFNCSICRRRQNYSKLQLLSFIKNFKKRYNKIPTATDFRENKLFPNPTTYIRNFGSWNKAINYAQKS